MISPIRSRSCSTSIPTGSAPRWGCIPTLRSVRSRLTGSNAGRAERLSVMLGRLGGSSRSVAPTGLVELLGFGSAVSPDVERSWSEPATERLTVAVGSDDTGAPVTVGFRRDGPHGMIAGTTGSGKSELLHPSLRHSRCVTRLIVSPSSSSTTKGERHSLPWWGSRHVVGLVTDLEHDVSLATRALTALDAEIDRRKRVLESAGVPDVVALSASQTRSAWWCLTSWS